jgi:hypothetical protein
MIPTDPLELTILLYKNSHNREVKAGLLTGELDISINFALITKELEAQELLINSNANTRSIESHLAKGFFLSMDDLLGSPARRVNAQKKFYLADSDTYFNGNFAKVSPLCQQYFAATKLYELLSKIADHHGGIGDAKTLIFLSKEKFEITPQYTAAELKDLNGLEAFDAQFISTDTHLEQKKTILKMSLAELFSGRNKFPFSELLTNFSKFIDKVQASYELYVAEFSFQKVKAEVEKEKLDAMVKLNKVFSDIQNQLLAVPAALILIGGQMENKGEWVSKNVLIWLGALVFAILMDLLIRNQTHTLSAVKHEVDQQRLQIETKYQSVAPRFQDIYQEISERHNHQKRMIQLVDALVALCLATSTIVLVCFSGVMGH